MNLRYFSSFFSSNLRLRSKRRIQFSAIVNLFNDGKRLKKNKKRFKELFSSPFVFPSCFFLPSQAHSLFHISQNDGLTAIGSIDWHDASLLNKMLFPSFDGE